MCRILNCSKILTSSKNSSIKISIAFCAWSLTGYMVAAPIILVRGLIIRVCLLGVLLGGTIIIVAV